MRNTQINEQERPLLLLWERVLALVEQDLSERRSRRVVVEVPGGEKESGSYEKEIGELSVCERQSLPPVLRERVVEQVLDRYLAEQGYVDLVDKRRTYTKKKIEELTPEDLPALIEAERLRVEEEHHGECERAMFTWEVRADLDRLAVVEVSEEMAGGRSWGEK